MVPFEIREEKPGLFPPSYHLKASDMKTPQVLPISTAHHFVYLDQDRRSLRVPDPADTVAKAIVEDYVTSQLGVDDTAKPALFWVPEEVEAPQAKLKFAIRISEVLVLQKNWMLNVARIADNDWSRYHQHNVVSDFQRQCAAHIGWKAEDHEWMNQLVIETELCPACRTPIPKSAIICSVCKLILNEGEAQTKGLKFATI